MPKLIFINLPVADLPRSVAFYEAVGATLNPLFSDETAACMVFSDTIHAMLLTHEKWATFTDRAIPDAKKTAQVLICVSEDSREGVDAVVDRAAAAGGQADPNARQDYGFMYGRSYADPDGHIWRSCGWTRKPPPRGRKPSPPRSAGVEP
ncbi:VOC family protein [Brevundimonas diminuta]|uniref:Predicted lactoylglutathione lyase n=1 Tax=Brevundimonas diminuta TaxID=293 RepID=A0A2X1AVQ2_BREDI|nr:VOC family protein [Brevundimonas diminuta]SPU42634.1 Predicted lactoylglutathione lyase [Brevundimonas diminuta]